MKHKLPVRGRTARFTRGPHVCPVCEQEKETLAHCFYSYAATKEVLEKIRQSLGLENRSTKIEWVAYILKRKEKPVMK